MRMDRIPRISLGGRRRRRKHGRKRGRSRVVSKTVIRYRR